ncbi:MAG: response regulator transcription factor [Dehalococcoidales bacterium]|nr:MAG: response regulator transcription factor [Dehalococcoidales bacterium]
MDQVKIFITDNEAVFRTGICYALSEIDTFEVIGEAGTGTDTLERISKIPPDLLIMNTNHSRPSGTDVTRYITHTLPYLKVILMMDEYNTELVVGAMKSGAKTCVSKSIDLDSLLLTVSRVIHDELPISHYLLKPGVADRILKEYEESTQTTKKADRSEIKLVQSEEMILTMIRDDTSLINLTSRLGVSEEIIIDYLDEIAEKLVKIEHYNENLEQKYIKNLITRSTGVTASGKKGIRFDTEGREKESIAVQSAELGEPGKDFSEAIELARKAGRLSSIQAFNQMIITITEELMTEIDRRRRILRRIRKSIEFELEFVKDSDITWI